MSFLFRLFRANRIEGAKCFFNGLFLWLFGEVSDLIEGSNPLKRLIYVVFHNRFFKESGEKALMNTFFVGFFSGLINNIPTRSEKGDFDDCGI